MQIIIGLLLGVLDFIKAVFFDTTIFIVVFLVVGISTILFGGNEGKAAGVFCLILAIIVFVRAVIS